MIHPIEKIRNVAIIAHIDHGKTTMIDAILKSARVFRENQHVGTCVMDSGDLERERGITITAKNCSVLWNDLLINVVDTPGHADFSGEVERVLSMVDSCLLLVDANEGPMPQTRYVLMRALALGLKPIVILNKVDRPNADPKGALEKTFELFIELGANDEQADFKHLYASGLGGWCVKNLDDKREGMEALFQTIEEHVAPPKGDRDGDFLMQVTTLAWSDYIGRIACGRVLSGIHTKGQYFVRTTTRWPSEAARKEKQFEVVGTSNERSTHLWVTRGIGRIDTEKVGAGDIVWIAGPEDINIGDTFSSPDLANPALPPLDIEEPTVSMFFLVNSGPLAGQDGKAITLRQLRERLMRETRTNVSLRVEDIGRGDGLKVSGRGELHLGILIESMRREGMEFCVSRPEVITRKNANGQLEEPMELAVIDVPEEYQGAVIEKLARRKGEMVSMHNGGTGTLRMEFSIPTRGLIGYRNEFLTDTRGLGILASRFVGYGPWKGEIPARNRGSMVSRDDGPATTYQLENLQIRGTLFVKPGTRVYKGMIIGEHSRPDDMPCNPTKAKKLTNHRSSTKEAEMPLDSIRILNLDQAIEWIADDELVEITPSILRLRKIILDWDEHLKREKQRAAAIEASV